MWSALQTQWRTGPAGAVGLDYPAAEVTARWLGIEPSRALWRKIRLLEAEALRRLYERGQEQAERAG